LQLHSYNVASEESQYQRLPVEKKEQTGHAVDYWHSL